MSETYFGKPCARGHSGERLSSNRQCVMCNRANAANVREARKAAKAQGLARGRDELSMIAIWYPEEFDRSGWRRAGRATVEY